MGTQSTNCIMIPAPDKRIQTILASATLPNQLPQPSLHFAQNEEFFIKLARPFTVPHVDIHHDITSSEPEESYVAALAGLLSQLVRIVPQIFEGVSFFFDPTDIFHPCFYRLLGRDGKPFLFLLRLDIGFKSSYAEIKERGANDVSHSYTTSSLFCEGLIIPVSRVVPGGKSSPGDAGRGEGGMEYWIDELVSETWIGETGRGYRVKGIWIDDDLSKFFTRLFTSPGKRLYPFFPFVCRYKTICQSVIRFGTTALEAQARLLESAMRLLAPEIGNIEAALKKNRFHEELPELMALKKKVDPALCSAWDDVIVETYPNQQGNREYLVSETTH